MKDGLRMINITISGMFLLFVIASPLIAANEKVGTDPAASLSSARETDVVGTKPARSRPSTVPTPPYLRTG